MTEVLQRCVVEARNEKDRFYLQEKIYNNQFSSLYKNRLLIMKPHLSNAAKKKWGPDTEIFSPLIEVESYFVENQNSMSPIVLIGNVFKDLTMRPSVLHEQESENSSELMADFKEKYYEETDKIFLEDESGRIELTSNDKKWMSSLVTGVTIAVLGVPNEMGQFEVNEFCAAYPDFVEGGGDESTSDDNSPFVLFVSGLEFGSSIVTSDEDANGGVDEALPVELSAQMLADFVSGRLGEEQDLHLASRISRVIICGNSISAAPKALAKERTSNAKSQHEMKSCSKQLLGSCPVDVMPGRSDPSNSSLPQQPLNACFTPQSNRFSSYFPRTNPFESSLQLDESNATKILGHAGSPVQDISRQSPERPPIDILYDTLRWGNICPTAPDTMPSYPYQDTDPFVIEPSHLPNIYFAGNQESFESKLVVSSTGHRTRLLCIPKFSTSREAVLVNLSTLDCKNLQFGP